MTSLLEDDIEPRGDLSIAASDFDDGGRMPDYVGYVNDNENPELQIDGVPPEAESLVLVCDDPDARPVIGFAFDHWLVWDLAPDRGTIPRGWNPSAGDATVGYNDFVEADYGGPSPPDGPHQYRFKLLALDAELDLPPEARKAVVQMNATMEAEILAATQLTGEYDPSQGTLF